MKQIRWFLAASLFTSVALAGSLNSSVRVGDGGKVTADESPLVAGDFLVRRDG